MIKNRLNSEISEAIAIITESPVPATDDEAAPMNPPRSSVLSVTDLFSLYSVKRLVVKQVYCNDKSNKNNNKYAY